MARTKGDLCGISTREETSYGVIPSGTSVYQGTCLTLSDGGECTTEETQQCGSRVRGSVYRTSQSAGYSATFNMVQGCSWEEWVRRAAGSLSGVSRDLPSFDTAIRVSPSEVHLWTGCKVNTLTLSAPSIGAKVEFSADVVARWHTMTPFTDENGSTLSMDPVAVPTGIPVRYNAYWEYSLDGTTFMKIKGKSFTLTIGSSLSSEPGIGGGIELSAGEGSTPQESSITLDITITSTGPEWDRLRLAFTTGMTFRIVLDGKTVTLSGCNLDTATPDRSQGSYDETISVTATDIAVS